jgi:ATP-binding cassette subfamily B protein
MDILGNLRSLKTLNKYLWRYKWHLFGGIVFVIISNFFAVVPAQMVRKAFDAMIANLKDTEKISGQNSVGIMNQVLFYAAVIIGMALLKGLFMFMMRQTLVVMSRHIEYDLKNDIYAHLQKLSLSFYRRNNTGDLMARITEDVSRVRMYLGPAIMYIVNLCTLIILVVGIMLSVNVKLTLCVLFPLPILAFSIYYVNSITFRRSTAIQQQLSQITTFVQEVFSGIRVVKSFSAETSVEGHFKEEVDAYKERSLAQVKVDAMFFPLIALLIGISTLVTLFVGGQEVIKGNITPGVIAEFFIYVSLLSWPVASLGWTSSLIQRAAASQTRINQLLHVQPEITDTATKEENIIGDIKLKNVSFTYPDTGMQALQNVNLHILPGESLGIIGRTGSGKSTLAHLLLRSYDVTEGDILVDDKNIKNLNLGSYREQVGYVPQDDFLFSETLAHNILFSKKDFSSKQEDKHLHISATEKMLWAANVADVKRDIEGFRDGFETMIGERGITLSGGQKQRVSIARAIVNDPKILILDDCFSAIDTNTEARILNNLGEVMKNKTSIIISHRVSSVKNAKHIVVLDAGKIMEEGTHETLMRNEGYYYMLYRKQLMEKELYEQQQAAEA